MNNTKLSITVKIIVISLWCLVAAAFETSVLSSVRLFGAAPMQLATVVAAVAICEGPSAGAVCGALCGLLYDSLGSASLCCYTLCFALFGALAGAIGRGGFGKKGIKIALLGVLGLLTAELARFFFCWFFLSRAPLSAVATVILPKLLYTFILSPLSALPVRLLDKKFNTESSLFR